MNPRAAFSLVELLVVIATIALLTGLTLPALQNSRESARRVVCASNVRQLQMANDFHADAHDDRYAPGAFDILANRHRWHGSRAGSAEAFAPDGGAITPFIDAHASSVALRECPTFAGALDELRERGMGFEAGCGGYGYNNAFVGVDRRLTADNVWEIESDRVGARRTRFARSAGTIAFTDAAFPDSRAPRGLIEYSFAEPRLWPHWPAFRPDASTHFRHLGAASVAWLDGHVSAETRTLAWSGMMSGGESERLGLGWFGERDDNALYDYD